MIICSYYYFLKVKIRSQARVCNSFRNVIQNVESLKDVAIVPVIRNHYRIHYWYMSKGVVINGTNGADLKETDACNIKKLKNLFLLQKVSSNNAYYLRNKEMLQEHSGNCYQEGGN